MSLGDGLVVVHTTVEGSTGSCGRVMPRGGRTRERDGRDSVEERSGRTWASFSVKREAEGRVLMAVSCLAPVPEALRRAAMVDSVGGGVGEVRV